MSVMAGRDTPSDYLTTMPQTPTESVVGPGLPAVTPSSMPTRDELPKLKGRKRLLQSLQRMTSSQSLARAGKASPSIYRPGGRGSISCGTLGANQSSYALASPHGQSSRNIFSTAPASRSGTPGVDTPFIDAFENGQYNTGYGSYSAYQTPMIGPFTADPNIAAGEDYFSRPRAMSQRPKPCPDFDFWGEMPGELKLHILSFLKQKEIVRCSRVSKSWYRTCFDGQLWADLDATEYYKNVSPETLTKIITRAGPFVKDLNLRGCIQLWDSWGQAGLPDACRNLENLSLQDCRLDRGAMHNLICQNNRLVHINLTRLTCVHNSTMRIIAQSCPKLELLNVNWCTGIDTRGLRKVIESCPNLRDLRAGEVRGFDDVEFMLELFKRNTLERLLIPNCDTLNDDSFAALIEGVDEQMDYISGRRIVPPRRLKHLDLSRCRNISDDGIRSMINNMPDLEGLQLTRCKALSDDGLKPLLLGLPNLTHLDLEEVELITNATLQELARAPCRDTLEHLCVSYCENIGDLGMLAVLKNCLNIKNLDLDNTRISDLTLAEAAAMVSLRSSERPPMQRAMTWDGISAATRGSAKRAVPLKPKIGLCMGVYDCQNVTWTGIREVLSRNTEFRPPMPFSLNLPMLPMTRSVEAIPSLPHEPIHLPPTDHINHQEATRAPAPSVAHPTQIISLKVFYGYQPTVTEHTRRVLRGDFASAARLERKWAEYMVASEEAGAALGPGTGQGVGNVNALVAGFGTVGSRRRRRRVREAQMMHADEEEGGLGGTGIGRRRRARSGGSCAVM